MAQRLLFLDPGVLLNLCVLEESAQILAALPYKALTTSAISNAMHANDSGGDTPSYSAEPLIKQGVLHLASLEAQDATERFFELACLGLRDTLGELAALASLCDSMIATDDPAAIDALTSVLPDVPLLTTVAILHEYVELTSLSRASTAQIVTKLREEAIFTPSQHDPFREWWHDHLSLT